MALPLDGIRVLDFSTLLPGPLASLILGEAGASVTKIERPGGEDMRRFEPLHGSSSRPFMALNGGKAVETLDLKVARDVERARALAMQADILIEQFRPGVMERLGLGFAALHAANPRLIYCSITGFGQTGPRRGEAGHDLNYQALSGLLSQSLRRGGPAPLPPPLIADIAGGGHAAVLNILLALRERDATGVSRHLDISMTEGAAGFAWFGETQGDVSAEGGRTLLTGASPRYQIYRTADGWFLAVAALEDKFWAIFCEAVDLPIAFRGADAPADEARNAVAAIVAARTSQFWRERLEKLDCCCTVVRELEEARLERQAAGAPIMAGDETGARQPLVRLPLCAAFRAGAEAVRAVPPQPGFSPGSGPVPDA
jgi:crotonobetainyl-CoA:carnitine CoA-transferase CaiB-like acyl-CoA transferase